MEEMEVNNERSKRKADSNKEESVIENRGFIINKEC